MQFRLQINPKCDIFSQSQQIQVKGATYSLQLTPVSPLPLSVQDRITEGFTSRQSPLESMEGGASLEEEASAARALLSAEPDAIDTGELAMVDEVEMLSRKGLFFVAVRTHHQHSTSPAAHCLLSYLLRGRGLTIHTYGALCDPVRPVALVGPELCIG